MDKRSGAMMTEVNGVGCYESESTLMRDKQVPL